MRYLAYWSVNRLEQNVTMYWYDIIIYRAL